MVAALNSAYHEVRVDMRRRLPTERQKNPEFS